MKSNKDGVRTDIEKATPANSNKPKSSGKGGGNPPAPPSYISAQFTLKDNGWFHQGKDSDTAIWLCGYFKIEAETIDDENCWGVHISWRDRNGQPRSEVFPRKMLTGDCTELRGRLSDGGVMFNGHRDAKQRFQELVNTLHTSTRARCVARTGWHVIGGKRVMVLHDEVFGYPAETVILQTPSREQSLFNQAGTLDAWKSEISLRCMGNSRLVLAISMAFAAPLLDLVGEDGGGVHLVGGSRIGKTTAALVAASVCGGDPSAGGARGFMRSWRTTANGLESVAAHHSDCGLILDELGQADGRDVGTAAYMLSTGTAKYRSQAAGGLRVNLKFRVLFLSTGELTLRAKVAEAGPGAKTFAGMEVRMVDLPADAGKQMGILTEIHDAAGPGEFVQSLRDAATQNYGVAFRVFLKKLCENLEKNSAFVDELKGEIEVFLKDWLAPFPSLEGGQVRSVARRFALIAAAGKLATKFGITGWAGEEAGTAAYVCLLDWMDQRGTKGAREDADAVIALRNFVTRHGSARFEKWPETKVVSDGLQNVEELPPPDRMVINRAGYKRWSKELASFIFYLTPDAMNEAMAGLNFREAVVLLAKRGFILPAHHGRNSQVLTVPGLVKKIRLYVVPSAVMGAEADDTLIDVKEMELTANAAE